MQLFSIRKFLFAHLQSSVTTFRLLCIVQNTRYKDNIIRKPPQSNCLLTLPHNPLYEIQKFFSSLSISLDFDTYFYLWIEFFLYKFWVCKSFDRSKVLYRNEELKFYNYT